LTALSTTRLSYPVPYTCQFATPDLVANFLFDGRPLQSDPNWAEYGADTPDQYAHWAMRSCGVVCVKMVAEGLGAPSRSVMAWIQAGLALDGYLTDRRAERPVEIGWKHSALAELARQHGCHAERLSGLGMVNLAALVRTDRCFLASVSSEIGEGEDVPITRRNGHVVVVHGFAEDADNRLTHFMLHNPSGRSPDLRENARIPVARFAEAFSGRGIAVGPVNSSYSGA
jgi:hypothetical protein